MILLLGKIDVLQNLLERESMPISEIRSQLATARMVLADHILLTIKQDKEQSEPMSEARKIELYDEAIIFYSKAVFALRAIFDEADKEDLRLAADRLASAYLKLARAESLRGDWVDSHHYYSMVVGTLDPFKEAGNISAPMRYQLALAHFELARTDTDTVEQYKKLALSVNLLKGVIAESPETRGYQLALARSLQAQAELSLLTSDSDPQHHREEMDRRLKIYREMLEVQARLNEQPDEASDALIESGKKAVEQFVMQVSTEVGLQ